MTETDHQGQNGNGGNRDREWFGVANWVFDLAMPALSGNAFKVFCVVVRQTWGWKQPGATDNKTRKQWDIISWSQFRAKTGISGKDTLARALQECQDAGCVKRLAVGQSYAYGVSTSMETIPVQKQDQDQYGNGTGTGMETIHTKPTLNQSLNQSVGGVLPVGEKTPTGDAGASPPYPPDYDQVLDLLSQWNVRKRTGRQLALECPLAQVEGWTAETRRLWEQGKLTNPTGFLVAMLQAGEPVPARCVTCDGEPVAGRVCQGCGGPLCKGCSWLFESEKGQGVFWCEPCINTETERRNAAQAGENQDQGDGDDVPDPDGAADMADELRVPVPPFPGGSDNGKADAGDLVDAVDVVRCPVCDRDQPAGYFAPCNECGQVVCVDCVRNGLRCRVCADALAVEG